MSQTSDVLPSGVVGTLCGKFKSHGLQITGNLVTFLAVAMATLSAKAIFFSLGVNSRHSFQANALR